MSSIAYADGWLVAETPAAVALTDAQAGVFSPGVMPAIGAYADNGWLALGLRLRSGVLRDGDPPGRHFKDPSLGSLTTTSAAVRLHHGGAWVEGALGGGLTGDDLVPAAEAGLGWVFDAGAVELGPSLRFARVFRTSPMDTLGSADLLLVGVDLRFGADRPRRPRTAVPPPTIERERPSAIERDDDRIALRLPSCAEVVDGCTFGEIVIVDDRIVLPEHVLFDFERARVKSRGRAVLEQIALLWMAHPEWTAIAIEGHADVRGSDAFNLELSQRRADNVRAVLADFGRDPRLITATGFGRTRPRDPGSSEAAHQRNRRVELVIERRVEVFR